jgi:tRNA dimethylallyltransferase
VADPSEYPAVAVLGPTGSGKSALALSIARSFRGEVINCDALQIYLGMDIGTAKASWEERLEIPHHLLDLRRPGEDFSAGDYLRAGRETLRRIQAKGTLPVIAGGTGFYFRALSKGLFEGPGRSEDLRVRMRRVLERRGSVRLHRALARVDPEAAGRISPADASRIVRAYEVFLLTGKPISCWQQQPTDQLTGFRWLKLAISWPREALYERIDRRVDTMIQRGFIEEVRELLRSYPPDSHAFKAIGYGQIAAFLEGRTKLEDAVEEIKRETRRYAKRQLTWFRAENGVRWLEGTLGADRIEAQAAELVSSFVRAGDTSSSNP